MARYIDADRVIEAIKHLCWVNKECEKDAIYTIKNQPTADVVEVVRCKYCKHCELRYPAKAIGEEAIEGYYCHPNQRYVKSTDFCSYGERIDT